MKDNIDNIVERIDQANVNIKGNIDEVHNIVNWFLIPSAVFVVVATILAAVV